MFAQYFCKQIKADSNFNYNNLTSIHLHSDVISYLWERELTIATDTE